MRILRMVLAVTLLVNLPLLKLEARPQPSSPDTSGSAMQLAGGGGSIQYPSKWFVHHYANVQELWNITPEKLATLEPEQKDEVARIKIGVTSVASHEEALHRLREIEAEWNATPNYLVLGGWPALVRRQLIPKPREGGSDSASDGERLVMITTAVAVGKTVVRLDGFAPENASPEIVDQMETIERSWRSAIAGDSGRSNKEVENLRSSPSLRMPRAKSSADQGEGHQVEAPAGSKPAGANAPPTANVTPGAATNLGALDLEIGSESEVAVSSNGTNIVVAQQCRYQNSEDGGQSFPFGGFAPGNCTGGDSSIAYGQSGNFYWETIGSNSATCPVVTPPNPNCNNTQEMARSTNNGQTFSFMANIIDCQVTSGCGFGNVPDQDHIGADRFNAGSGGDQVYMVFRQGYGFGISCSQDSANSWSAVAFYNNGSTDFPRITVSQNGTVFVVTNNGNNIELWSFSSCKSGLTPGLSHVTIASGINQVSCPVAGLDRCNNGNILSSHTVAVDDTNANHLYASYAVNTVTPPSTLSFPGNENVLVEESTNGGSSWSSAVQINQGTSGTGGRRFQPWVCVTRGTAYVSWFDRRASTAVTNDVTDYFTSSAFDSGGSLTGGSDFQIDANGDPQCASGWPCLCRSQNDSNSCSAQPQFGGSCGHSPSQPGDSHTPCDFAAPVCPGTESCQTGGGCPKYADYTGNACLLGRLYNAWPSATNQPNAAPTGGNIVSFFAETVVGSTGTTTTYTGPSSQSNLNSVTLSASLVLQGTAVPVVGQTITFTLGTQGCSGSTNSSGVASCTFTLSQTPGLYTVNAAFAGSGNYLASSNSAPFAITEPPTITSANHTTFQVGLSRSFQVTATGFPTTITFSTGGPLPNGVTLSSSGLLSGTPATGTQGIYNFTITASNGVLPNGTQAFTLMVDLAPTITSVNHATFTIGEAASFQVTYTGFPTPTISSPGPFPGGITLSSAGLLGGTAAPGTAGVYHFVITASNGALPNATQNFTLTVKKAVTTCSIYTSSSTFTPGQPITFTAYVTTASGEVNSPTGTVNFISNANYLHPLGTSPVANGAANFTTELQPPPDKQYVRAIYSGDSSFLGCESPFIAESLLY